MRKFIVSFHKDGELKSEVVEAFDVVNASRIIQKEYRIGAVSIHCVILYKGRFIYEGC